MKDLSGSRFNMWTVQSFSHRQNSGYYWNCLCDCGTVKKIKSNHLKSGASKSCGCQLTKDLVGQRFGRLLVVDKNKRIGNHQYWHCVCNCGSTKNIRGDVLINGSTQSCGCYAKEVLLKKVTTHGLSKTSIYRVHSNMIERCYCPENNHFHSYGGRGISVCKEWEDVMVFWSWAIDSGYKEGLTLDRINVNGNYEPSNCRWATPKEQSNNTRRNIFKEHNGETKTMKQWSEHCGIDYYTFRARIRKLHWPIEKALTTPVRTR